MTAVHATMNQQFVRKNQKVRTGFEIN